MALYYLLIRKDEDEESLLPSTEMSWPYKIHDVRMFVCPRDIFTTVQNLMSRGGPTEETILYKRFNLPCRKTEKYSVYSLQL